MTADQRLDQLEPLVSQTLAVADRHTAQLKQLVGIAIQHTDDIQFVLRKLSDVKQDIGEMKQSMVALNEAQTAANSRIDAVDASIRGLDSKLDRILGMLDGGK